MEGLTIVIDPAPTEEGTPDATLDVARRLRSLLEASGATVVTLRSAEATDTSDAARALIAEDAAPTAAVGLSIAETGEGGRVVTAPSGSFAVGVVAERLAQAAASQLATTAPPATRAEPPADDPVFGGLSAPWMRVQIGSAADRTDLTSFSDPRWADRVARGIYMAIGEVFGVEEDS
jgi:N-acetylmuramoyl-L-alanine amidase